MRTPSIAAAVALSSLFSCSGNDDRQLNEPSTDATGLSARSLLHDGVAREYILYVPDSYDGASDVPLMLNFHGFGGTAAQHLDWADMRSLAEMDTFLLVYPQGTLLNGDPHWNAGLESEENKSDADDFGFVEALIGEISSGYRIDSTRVYACGYSNGAFFAYALACYHGDKIAAIGSVAGTMMSEHPWHKRSWGATPGRLRRGFGCLPCSEQGERGYGDTFALAGPKKVGDGCFSLVQQIRRRLDSESCSRVVVCVVAFVLKVTEHIGEDLGIG